MSTSYEVFDVQGNINTLAASAARDVAEAKQADKTYKYSWSHFTTFVSLKRSSNELDMGDKYLTRANVDLFFLEYVAKKKCSPSSCRRYVSALQYYADNVEHIEGLGHAKFIVESANVKSSLALQREDYKKKNSQKKY